MKSLLPIFRLAAILLLAGAAGCSREAKVEERLRKASNYFDNREFEKAKIEYLNVLRLQRTNSLALLNLGKIFYEQGQLREAYPLLLKSRDVFPADVPLREALITIYTTARTNKWRDEATAVLQRDPANETAVLAVAGQAISPAELQLAEKELAALRQRAGDRAIFQIAAAEIQRRRGDTAAAEKSLRAAVALEPKSVSSHMALGNLLAAQGQAEEASRTLQTAAELSPPYHQAHLRLAQFQLQNGRVEDAKKELDQITSKAPERTVAWVMRAGIALDEKQYDECSRLLDRALSQAPGDLDALVDRAQLKLAQNQPDEAVRLLVRLAQMYPQASQVQYQLGVAYLLNKDPNRAVGSLQRAVTLDPDSASAIMLLAELELAEGKTTEATAALTGLVNRFPQLAPAQYLLARAYRAAGRFDEAAALYRGMQKRFPKDPASTFQLGLVLRQQNKDAEARNTFEQVLQTSPDSFEVLEQLVGLDVEAKDFPAALRRVQQAIDKKPGAATPWLLLAQVQLAQTNLPPAEVALKKAIELDANLQPAYMALADLYVVSGRRAEALTEAGRLLEKNPDNVGALVLSGILEAGAGNYDRARAAYEHALRLAPQSALVINNLAYLLAERFGKLDAAREMALKGHQLAPGNPVLTDTLGWIEFKRGDYPEALRLLSESIEKLGRNPEVQYHLGMAYYMTGQEEPARIALEKAVNSRTKYIGRDLAGQYLEFLKFDSKQADDQLLAALEKRRRESPTDIIALTRLGAFHEAAGSYPKALEAYEAALKINPQSVRVLARLAELQAQHLNNPARALELARTARNLAPDDPNVALTLGRLALTAGDPAWSYSLLQESARRLTNRVEINHDLAWAAYDLGRLEEADRVMDTVARSAGPTNLVNSARWFLAMTALARNPAGLAQAQPQITQLLQADPNHTPALFASALLAEQQGRYPDARQTYEKLLARYPTFTPGVRQLAILLADHSSDDAKAYELAMKARADLPKDDVLTAALGKLACRRADYRYAIQLLREASPTRSTDAELFYYLGVAHHGLKEKPESKAALEKALNLDPNAKFAPEAKRLLSEVTSA